MLVRSPVMLVTIVRRSSGIGAATARLCVEQGACCWSHDATGAIGTGTRHEKAVAFSDVTRQDDVKAASPFQATGTDVVVNNAGKVCTYRLRDGHRAMERTLGGERNKVLCM